MCIRDSVKSGDHIVITGHKTLGVLMGLCRRGFAQAACQRAVGRLHRQDCADSLWILDSHDAGELRTLIAECAVDLRITGTLVIGLQMCIRDRYGAGPDQDINNPLGVGGTELHQWLVPTRTFQRALFGKDGGTTGVNDDFAARGFQNVGAWILAVSYTHLDVYKRQFRVRY